MKLRPDQFRFRIVRVFKTGVREVIYSNVSLAQVNEHMRSDESSSATATSKIAKELTKKRGLWIDEYEREDL